MKIQVDKRLIKIVAAILIPGSLFILLTVAIFSQAKSYVEKR